MWTYCNNKCRFLGVSRIVGEGLNLSTTNFTSVCMWQRFKKEKEEKKDDKIRDGRGTLPNRPISTCHSQFFNQTWLSAYFLFCFCIWKKKKKKGWHVPRCLAILFSNTVSWGAFSPSYNNPPTIIYPVTAQSEPPQCKTWSVTLFLSSSSECFLLFVRVNECVQECVAMCVRVC